MGPKDLVKAILQRGDLPSHSAVGVGKEALAAGARRIRVVKDIGGVRQSPLLSTVVDDQQRRAAAADGAGRPGMQHGKVGLFDEGNAPTVEGPAGLLAVVRKRNRNETWCHRWSIVIDTVVGQTPRRA